MIAGHFIHEGLCQLCTKLLSFVRSWQKPLWPKRPAIIVIDSATYLLTISSPDINKVAMSLYDIKIVSDWVMSTVYAYTCPWAFLQLDNIACLLLVSACTILQMAVTAEEVRGWLWKNRWYILGGATIMVVGGVVVIVYGGTIVASIGACWTAVVTALGKTPIAITIGKCG